MDDNRFDALTRALATGTNRRQILKGLLGIGAVATTSTVRSQTTDAARRPTPTPKPPVCPGQQIWRNGACGCPANTVACGLDCCNPAGNGAVHSECCDNACCSGTCYGEELCCPTNNRGSGQFTLLPTHKICDTVDGPECCAYSDVCCLVDGCCPTVCYSGSVDADRCCPEADFCPGGSETDGICCTGNTTCCGGGTNANTCIDLGIEGTCCVDSDCADPCQLCNSQAHTCRPRCNTETETCCSDQAGGAVCQPGNCCPDGRGCDEDQLCCVTGALALCEPGPFCGCDRDDDCTACYVCNRGTCEPGADFDLATEFCCGDTPCANDRECCQTGGLPYLCLEAGSICCQGDADCPPIFEICDTQTNVCVERCTGSTPQLCNNTSGIYCIPEQATCCDGPANCPGDCEDCDDQGYCVQRCDAATEACCNAACYTVDTQVCCDTEILDGNCCAASDCEAGQTCCGSVCCPGQCYGESACCPGPRDVCAVTNECCADGAVCCPSSGCCDTATGRCCQVNGATMCVGYERCCGDADCTQFANSACDPNGQCYCTPNTCSGQLGSVCGTGLADGCGSTIADCRCGVGEFMLCGSGGTCQYNCRYLRNLNAIYSVAAMAALMCELAGLCGEEFGNVLENALAACG